MTKSDLTPEILRDLYDYDPESGRLFHRFWYHGKKKIRKGTADGRYTLSVGGKSYQEHRVVWLWHYGEWPKHNIDHIDRNPLNNRIENLRDITQAENKQNQLKLKTNATGLKGVWHSKNRYIAQIQVSGVKHYLGCFKTADEASKAYNEAARRLHKFNPSAG